VREAAGLEAGTRPSHQAKWVDELDGEFFADMGFLAVAEGPRTSRPTTYNLHQAQFRPRAHPGAATCTIRFYFNPKPDGSRLLLRTHTSPRADQDDAGAEAGRSAVIIPGAHLSQRQRSDPHAHVPSGLRGLVIDKSSHLAWPVENGYCRNSAKGVSSRSIRFKMRFPSVSFFLFSVYGSHRSRSNIQWPAREGVRSRILATATTGWRFSGCGMVHTERAAQFAVLDPRRISGLRWVWGSTASPCSKYGMPDLRRILRGRRAPGLLHY